MIHTERLILRPWKEGDLAPFAAMNADLRVREFFPGVLTTAESDAEARCFQNCFTREGFCLFAAELRSEGRFIGIIGMQTMNFAVPSLAQPAVEIGWRLATAYWGNGLATEGARAVLEHAFQVVNLHRVVAITVPSNLRSRHVMEKIGMSYLPELDFNHPGISEGHMLKPHVLYQLTRQVYGDTRKDKVSLRTRNCQLTGYCLPTD